MRSSKMSLKSVKFNFHFSNWLYTLFQKLPFTTYPSWIGQLPMLLFPNALCCSLYERNCVCAVTKIFTKFLNANNFCQLLRVTRKRSCTFETINGGHLELATSPIDSKDTDSWRVAETIERNYLLWLHLKISIASSHSLCLITSWILKLYE